MLKSLKECFMKPKEIKKLYQGKNKKFSVIKTKSQAKWLRRKIRQNWLIIGLILTTLLISFKAFLPMLCLASALIALIVIPFLLLSKIPQAYQAVASLPQSKKDMPQPFSYKIVRIFYKKINYYK